MEEAAGRDSRGGAKGASECAASGRGADAVAAPEGVLLIDKPERVTSHDVVAGIRGRLGGVKTGHAGTLDPFATGLLLILLGRATKLQSRLMELQKTYEVIAQLGARSSTGDPEGEIKHTGSVPPDPPDLPTGQIRQRPPIYSAVKIRGQRAYRRARRGETFQMPERVVSVYRFTQTWRQGDRAGYEIECSSGTYVRSLIADLQDAYCLELRRTAIGPFAVDDALAPPRRGEPWHPPAPMPVTQALRLLEGFEGPATRR